MIKVAIDTGPLKSGHKVRGIGVHTGELIKALKRLSLENIKIDYVDFSKVNLSSYDIAHYQYFNPFFLTLPSTKVAKKMVVTIHDLIQLVYPKRYKPGIKGKINFIKQKSRLKRFDAIITISETSKKDIIKFLGIEEKMIHVVYLAPKSIFRKLEPLSSELKRVAKKYSLPEKFVLYVGDVNYNKNIPTLIEACKLANLKLVLVGKQAKEIENLGIEDLRNIKGPRDYIRYLFGIPHPELSHYRSIISMFDENVFRLGYVPDEDLVALYNLATLYCQPSYYEGFGLGVLEAMASGCPVVASKTPALVEIAESSALFANPKDPNSFAQQFEKLNSSASLRKELEKEGSRKVKEYTWEKTATETLKVYKSIT